MERDAALAELFCELLARVLVLLRDERQHLDDRDVGAEAVEDRGELAADDPAAEHGEAARNAHLREQAGRVDDAGRVETGDRRPDRERARRDDRLLEGDVLSTFNGERIRVFEAAVALDPFDAVRLEQAGDALRHLLDDARLPRVRSGEVELGAGNVDAELREVLLRLLQRESGLHPRLRRNAADAEAGASQLGLLLDARDLRAELRGADRGGVTAGTSSENCDVDVHAVQRN